MMDPNTLLFGFFLLILAGLGGLLLHKPPASRKPDATYHEFRNDRR